MDRRRINAKNLIRYSQALIFLITVCGSALSIGPQTSDSKNHSVAEFGQIQFNDVNFSDVSPKLYRKNFELLSDVWSTNRIYFRNSFERKSEVSGVTINADWAEYFNEIGRLNELIEEDDYVETLKQIDRLTENIDELILADTGEMYLKSHFISELMGGIELAVSAKGKVILIDGQVLNGDVYIEIDDTVREGNADVMWVRFLGKLAEAYTLFNEGKIIEMQQTIRLLMVTNAINGLILNEYALRIMAPIELWTNGIHLIANSDKVILNGTNYLRYDRDGIFTEAGGPVFFRGKKISEGSKRIRSISTVFGKVLINFVTISQDEFYEF